MLIIGKLSGGGIAWSNYEVWEIDLVGVFGPFGGLSSEEVLKQVGEMVQTNSRFSVS